jgi:hypothetical protein
MRNKTKRIEAAERFLQRTHVTDLSSGVRLALQNFAEQELKLLIDAADKAIRDCPLAPDELSSLKRFAVSDWPRSPRFNGRPVPFVVDSSCGPRKRDSIDQGKAEAIRNAAQLQLILWSVLYQVLIAGPLNDTVGEPMAGVLYQLSAQAVAGYWPSPSQLPRRSRFLRSSNPGRNTL